MSNISRACELFEKHFDPELEEDSKEALLKIYVDEFGIARGNANIYYKKAYDRIGPGQKMEFKPIPTSKRTAKKDEYVETDRPDTRRLFSVIVPGDDDEYVSASSHFDRGIAEQELAFILKKHKDAFMMRGAPEDDDVPVSKLLKKKVA